MPIIISRPKGGCLRLPYLRLPLLSLPIRPVSLSPPPRTHSSIDGAGISAITRNCSHHRIMFASNAPVRVKYRT